MHHLRTPATLLALALPCLALAAPLRTVQEFQADAARFHSQITLPQFETTAAQVAAAVDDGIKHFNAEIDGIVRQDPAKATFESTFGAYDAINGEDGYLLGRIGLMQNTSTSKDVRDACEDGAKKLNDWGVSLDYRGDLMAVLKALKVDRARLSVEDQRLYDFTLRDYKRAGLDLAPEMRKKVEAERKQLGNWEQDFNTNIVETKVALTFNRAQLAGVPDSFLAQPGVKTSDDTFQILVSRTPQRAMIENNCSVAATRKAVTDAELKLAMEKNVPLFNQIVGLRAQIARDLGYGSWDDFKIEPKMAKDGATATTFIEDLVTGIQPKFNAEVSEMRALKVADTGDKNAQINYSDWRYYQTQLVKQKYTVDEEALRVYFPMEHVLKGMFDIYQSIFGLKFEQLENPYVWAPGVTLWGATDAKTGEPMGLFYLDLFPREGKYNHFAEFPIIQGHLLPDGTYQRPVVCLVCNFPPATKDAPSLMDHQEVTTIFHEFGHCMHDTMTRAHRARFGGTSVPGDFVEAPSQMLENWTYNKAVLDTFAADYRDPTKKIPAEILDRLEQVRLATIAVFYRRQLSFALLDLKVHGPRAQGAPVDIQKETNAVIDQVFFPVPDDSAFVAFFGHLAGGYDAGYYGYAWADAIAADMSTVFEQAPNGFLDVGAGMRMRNEIYSQGSARDVNVSIEDFLGRPRSLKPFLTRLGIKQD